MRTLAVSLLLFAATVYLLTLEQDGFLGFVNAGAEASMVGAIADWFASPRFRHRSASVPHTALVPKRKETSAQPPGVRQGELPAEGPPRPDAWPGSASGSAPGDQEQPPVVDRRDG
jgi:hypothetical protein